ncbi:MAG TPA: hypothetical protein VFZ89_18525 [Solirubrobacteraceae bacterium]
MSTRPPRDELAESTAVGDVYLRRLVRAQLSLSVLAVIAFGALLGALPLALILLPGLEDMLVLGLPAALWLVGAPMFVLLVALGFLYRRRADALDDAFRDIVRGPEP